MRHLTHTLALLFAATSAQAQIPRLNTPPKWSIGCDAKTKDQFGDSKRSYCWLYVVNSGAQLMDDNAWVMLRTKLFEIDAKGLTLAKPRKADRLCERTPIRIAVDGNRIDALPPAKQIEAILAGSRLTWEQQAGWPYCGIAPHGTYLDGVRAAVDDLKARWADIVAKR